jgi:tetratricopeptide (TPR) repeat protein
MRQLLLLALLTIFPQADRPLSVPGDYEFARGHYPVAVAAYDSLLRSSSDSAEVLWRLARVHICIGDVAEESQKEAAYQKAEGYARACLQADSTNSEGHAWLAAALGNIAVLAGGGRKVKLCTEIKLHLEKAILLDPANDVAYSILGSFYMALGNVSWIERQLAALFLGHLPDGGYDEAETALEHAVFLAPQVIRHHYELATLYRTTGRTRKALEEYQRTVTLPAVLASDCRTQDSARQWLLELSRHD